MSTAIYAEDLCKRYRLGTRLQGDYQTLRETVMRLAGRPWHWLRRRVAGSHGTNGSAVGHGDETGKTLWALKGVSFQVQPGEVVGIVGRNGAGKSTLLKVLSRITEPTAGRARLRGRIGSLLEVGTGFHQELTGRENIYLSGAILGMSRREVGRQFDAIVAFAGLEPFLDTPVKRYSSGMYVRLGFAVAAHLEPEILVVDEVLAVGDAEFQTKCLARMRQVGQEGRTILFVSHNLAAVQALCSRALLLQQGQLVADDTPAAIVSRYLAGLEQCAGVPLAERTDRTGAGGVRLVHLDIHSCGDQKSRNVTLGQPVRFRFHLDRLPPSVVCIFQIIDQQGCALAKFNSGLSSLEDCTENVRGAYLSCEIPQWLLAPGRYRLDVVLQCSDEEQDRLEAAAYFEVAAGSVRGREPPRSRGDWKVCMPHRWCFPGGNGSSR